MTAQLPLPFPAWRFPLEDARLLALANAFDQRDRGHYSWRDNWKHWYFYPLKSAILEAHAVPDGYDVQVLKLSCRTCGGGGIWYSEYSYFRDYCRSCCGTGVYRRDAVKLSRWLLAGLTFHCPEERERGVSDDLLAEWQANARDSFQGLIRHAPVSEADALRAFFILLRKYDRAQYDTLLDMRVRDAVLAFRERCLRPFKNAIQRAYWWLELSESRTAQGLREWFGIQSLPF